MSHDTMRGPEVAGWDPVFGVWDTPGYVAEALDLNNAGLNDALREGMIISTATPNRPLVIPRGQFWLTEDGLEIVGMSANVSELGDPSHPTPKKYLQFLFTTRQDLGGLSIITFVKPRPHGDFAYAGVLIEREQWQREHNVFCSWARSNQRRRELAEQQAQRERRRRRR